MTDFEAFQRCFRSNHVINMSMDAAYLSGYEGIARTRGRCENNQKHEVNRGFHSETKPLVSQLVSCLVLWLVSVSNFYLLPISHFIGTSADHVGLLSG